MPKIMLSAHSIYDNLLSYYGKQEWWPGDAYEIIVGAVLVLNTAWRNVEKVLAGFGGLLSPDYVSSLPEEALRGLIRPCGFFSAKAKCVKSVTEWYVGYGYSAAAARSKPAESIRCELMAIKGIGDETADAIMLYALRFPVFVVDAYTKRLLARLGIAAGRSYAAVQNYFVNSLPADTELYGSCHSLILAHSKRHCLKKPSCAGCPLAGQCGWGKPGAAPGLPI